MTRSIHIPAAVAMAAILMAGCTALTRLDATQPGVKLAIREKSLGPMPVTVDLKTTTFGNYQFKATRADGKSLYGILPLKFNGGYLAANILLFAPASFFNLREVYPLYEFDVDQGIVKYRATTAESWTETRPTADEAAAAKRFFGDV
jgi:hypothetical protein